ncbi:hypothetical protein KIH87_05845 [Paraneptunicella aestuarii]|uniref:hypothetical protein n=1 Tax=Paraneptunicella aestuarii TaxID=2831148 RepID=UPI001E2A01CD|nr:hypothetical protein [Paraneptunicella aestuarii]UAA39876.1 hypothetical protein KIH87_05845 [Paraneptunicella aestuarii]
MNRTVVEANIILGTSAGVTIATYMENIDRPLQITPEDDLVNHVDIFFNGKRATLQGDDPDFKVVEAGAIVYKYDCGPGDKLTVIVYRD